MEGIYTLWGCVWDWPRRSCNTKRLFAFSPIRYKTVQGQNLLHPLLYFPILFCPCLEFLNSCTLWKLIPKSHA